MLCRPLVFLVVLSALAGCARPRPESAMAVPAVALPEVALPALRDSFTTRPVVLRRRHCDPCTPARVDGIVMDGVASWTPGGAHSDQLAAAIRGLSPDSVEAVELIAGASVQARFGAGFRPGDRVVVIITRRAARAPDCPKPPASTGRALAARRELAGTYNLALVSSGGRAGLERGILRLTSVDADTGAALAGEFRVTLEGGRAILGWGSAVDFTGSRLAVGNRDDPDSTRLRLRVERSTAEGFFGTWRRESGVTRGHFCARRP